MHNKMEQVHEKYAESDALPDLELSSLVESMTPIERIAYKRRMLSEISDREHIVNIVNDVNAAEGYNDDSEVIQDM